MSKYKNPAEQLVDSRRLLEQSQQENFPYLFSYKGMDFEVHKNVFSPQYFNGWRIFTANFPSVNGKSVLEIGPGCGITSVCLAKQGARVSALDINQYAVENTKQNAIRNGVTIDVRQSDIYSALEQDEKFDYIYWNMPFVFVSPEHEFSDILERALVDPGYQLTERFVRDGRKHLKDSGTLLVGTGSFGDTQMLEEIARAHMYVPRISAREKSMEINPVEFILYELERAHNA